MTRDEDIIDYFMMHPESFIKDIDYIINEYSKRNRRFGK